MRRLISSIFVYVLLGGFTVAASQLPPEIMADRYLLQAERATQEQNFQGAKAAMDGILELQAQHDLELPAQFFFRYAEVLERLGLYDEAIEFVTQYLTLAGRNGEFYRAALELLDSAEQKLWRAEAEQQAAEVERRRAEAEQRENDDLALRQIEEAQIELPRDVLSDGGLAPEMVRIASGRRRTLRPRMVNLTGVEFDKPFAISRYEVTRGEFKRFVDQSRYRTEAQQDPNHGCNHPERDVYYQIEADRKKNSRRWDRTVFDQTDTHPVICVSTRDAMEYAEWLSRETGQSYRLPSVAEWLYAARAGSTLATLYDTYELLDPTERCKRGNINDSRNKCSDGVVWTAEIGRFQPNEVGLYDMIGNVAELVLSCYYHRNVQLAPEGSPELPDSCPLYVAALGGSWRRGSSYFSVSQIYGKPFREEDSHSGQRYYRKNSTTWVGFRIVRDLAD